MSVAAQVLPPPRRLTITDWLILIIASIGFMFDIYELLMLPLILGPALNDLIGAKPGDADFLFWKSMMFYVPAFVGGLLGLVGGYLTDRFGRRRVLTWSILVYAFSALGAGFSTNIWMLLILRCTTFAGFCVEFVAAVAWLAELFPNPRQKEWVLGTTQAFSSLGGLLVALVNGQIALLASGSFAFLAAGVSPAFLTEWIETFSLPAVADFLNSLLARFSVPAIFDGKHDVWRFTLMSGVIPALPLILIRPFLPESPTWKRKRDAGTLKRPSFGELFRPSLLRTTAITTLMFACSYGAAFGAIQQFPDIIRGLPEIQSLATPAQKQAAVANAQQWQEIGGLLGRVALAGLAVVIISRRKLIRVFQIPGLVILPFVFGVLAVTDLGNAKWGIAAVGFFTVAQFSFWGNYLPRVYPLHLRGTGQSFAANVGGRMLGVMAAPLAIGLSAQVAGSTDPERLAVAAAIVGTGVYLLGFLLSFFLPEPQAGEPSD